MVVAAIKTTYSKELQDFFVQTTDRFKYQMFLSEPSLKLYVKSNSEVYMISSFKNKFQFPLFEIGVLGSIAILLMLGLHWSLIIPFIPLVAGSFEKTWFVSLLLKQGLKKQGHKPTIQRLSADKLNEVLLADD